MWTVIRDQTAQNLLVWSSVRKELLVLDGVPSKEINNQSVKGVGFDQTAGMCGRQDKG